MMERLRKIILGLALAMCSIPLLVGIVLVWSVAVIPWLFYIIVAMMARLVGVNSVMRTLPEFIGYCTRPLWWE